MMLKKKKELVNISMEQETVRNIQADLKWNQTVLQEMKNKMITF